MRILLAYTNINVRGASAGGFPAMQLGIASIAGLLKARGHRCELLLVTEAELWPAARAKLEAFDPELVAYTAVTTQFPHVRELSARIRQARPGLFQICGGPHTTLSPEAALRAGAFDAVCVGEGEYPMAELAEALAAGDDWRGIANLCWREEGGEVHRNAPRPFVEDLDALPFFDRDLFADYVDLARYPHVIVTTRGCPFRCTYCCNHAFGKLAPGRYLRWRSVGNIIAEIEQLRRRWGGLSHLYIEDETVGIDRRLWAELLPALKRTGLTFGTNYRIGIRKPEFLEELREANFVRLNIGIESGNEWIRTHVLKRTYSNEEILDTYRRARELGMDTKAYNLIALPHETPEMFEDTLRVNQLARPGHTVLNVFYPYPGTELDRQCDELGLKPAGDVGPIRERTESILKLPDFPAERIMAYVRAWKQLVRLRPDSKWTRLRRKWLLRA